MKPEQLRQEINLELEWIESVVRELTSLRHDLAGRQPTVRETTAAAAFLAQFYNGLENILKRISRFYDVSWPQGETWHLDLFDRFCSPPYDPLPVLFNPELAAQLAPFRKFRHVVYHSYGFSLDWERMAEGVASIEHVCAEVKAALQAYMQGLDT